ncbi:hypothetical protein PACTADRAFT_52143 [Pachysolen tannophilus NRRL Y-2460]|uniref:BolA-like protein n=1 Tax=Pachysolen tannophilus NRRL Y-2460 TaxID=669874 RepID=A0A1E4TMV0_PACTA|nr:hypothetical protein PACTADRAFT_52143 [Pachysolen tannophilus NRRL Y-2460]
MSNKVEEEVGPIEVEIKSKIIEKLKPTHFAIVNDSWKHSGHHGLRGASNVTESHFRITVVSPEFEGKNQPTRHRLIYKILEQELGEKGVHALQLNTKTPIEWESLQKK